MKREPALGPVFVEVGAEGDPWMIDVTQVVEIWYSDGSFEYKTRDGSDNNCDTASGERLMEAMRKLNPRCNHCGQGSMQCDHCGAPL